MIQFKSFLITLFLTLPFRETVRLYESNFSFLHLLGPENEEIFLGINIECNRNFLEKNFLSKQVQNPTSLLRNSNLIIISYPLKDLISRSLDLKQHCFFGHLQLFLLKPILSSRLIGWLCPCSEYGQGRVILVSLRDLSVAIFFSLPLSGTSQEFKIGDLTQLFLCTLSVSNMNFYRSFSSDLPGNIQDSVKITGYFQRYIGFPIPADFWRYLQVLFGKSFD